MSATLASFSLNLVRIAVSRGTVPVFRCGVVNVRYGAIRGLLTLGHLELDEFNQQEKIHQQSYGKNGGEFKTSLIERLADREIEILTEDCLSYIYLMEKDDFPNVIKVLKRHAEQSKLNKLLPIADGAGVERLTGYALRKCHTLKMADEALKIYHSGMFRAEYCISSVIVLLDMLYENKHYKECAEIALRTVSNEQPVNDNNLQSKKKNSKIINNRSQSKDIQFAMPDAKEKNCILTLAFLSAYKMASPEGLLKAALVVKELKTMPGVNLLYFHSLLTAYTLQRGHINAALNMLKTPLFSDNYTIFTRVVQDNLKVMCYTKVDKANEAMAILRTLEQQVLKNSTSKGAAGPTYMLFDDVFKDVLYTARKSIHQDMIKRIRVNMSTLVHRKTIEEYLIHRITRVYAEPPKLSKTPTPEEEKEEELSVEKLLSMKSLDDEQAEDKVETPAKPPVVRSSSKMKIVNGYLVFTDEVE